MRASAIMLHPVRMMLPRTPAARRGIAAVMLTALLITGPVARAEIDGTTSVEDEALAQTAMEALSQGAAGPGPWKQRAMLVGLGVAALHLGASTGPMSRDQPGSAAVGAAYRLLLPAAGAALGSLVACHGPCGSQGAAAEPLLGAITGALVAHVLAPGTGFGRQERLSGDSGPAVEWMPLFSLGPGNYCVSVIGRF
jgi:hypothetical protein